MLTVWLMYLILKNYLMFCRIIFALWTQQNIWWYILVFKLLKHSWFSLRAWVIYRLCILDLTGKGCYIKYRCRFVDIQTDKVSFLCEPNCFMDEILACNCPTQNVILTAGTSSLVNVWFYQERVINIEIKSRIFILFFAYISRGVSFKVRVISLPFL